MIDLPKNLSFSDYLNINAPQKEILNSLGYSLNIIRITLPFSKDILLPHLSDLEENIEQTFNVVELTNETSRREILIAPVLFNIAKIVKGKLYFEYSVNISNHLRGRLDYYLQSSSNLIIVEAKNEDITAGFLQLAIELIAISVLIEKEVIYGVVTTGQIWQFSYLNKKDSLIVQDINIYTIPNQLKEIMKIIVGILTT